MSSLVMPDEWMTTVGYPKWRLYAATALMRAIQDEIQPAVDRATTIAVISTMELIRKDFSVESDESRIRTSAIQMATVSAKSLAHVTAREPMRNKFADYLREELEREKFPVDEQTVTECVTRNIDFACTVVEDSASSQATGKMQDTMAIELERRQTVPWKHSDSSVLRHWLALIPGPFQVDPTSRGLTQEQLDVYKSFSTIHAESAPDPWSIIPASVFAPSSNSGLPWQENPKSLGSSSTAQLWSGKYRPILLFYLTLFFLSFLFH